MTDGVAVARIDVLAKESRAAVRPSTRYLILTGVIVVIGIGVGLLFQGQRNWQTPSAPEVVAGVSAFALLYILAQAIERLVELTYPYVDFLVSALVNTVKSSTAVPAKDRKRVANQELGAARQLVGAAMAASDTNGVLPGGGEAVTEKTNVAQAEVAKAEKEVTLLAQSMSFAIAYVLLSFVPFSIAASAGLAGLHSTVDVLITALAIMGGSAALHDLVGRLQKGKEAQ